MYHLPDENLLCQESLDDMLMGSDRNSLYILPLYEILVPGMQSLVNRDVMEKMEAANDSTTHRCVETHNI